MNWLLWSLICRHLDWHSIQALGRCAREFLCLAALESSERPSLCCQQRKSSARCTLIAGLGGFAKGERQRLLQQLIDRAAQRGPVLVFGKALQARSNVTYLPKLALLRQSFNLCTIAPDTTVVFNCSLRKHDMEKAPLDLISLQHLFIVFAKRMNGDLWPHVDRVIITPLDKAQFVDKEILQSNDRLAALLRSEAPNASTVISLDATVPSRLAVANFACSLVVGQESGALATTRLLALLAGL